MNVVLQKINQHQQIHCSSESQLRVAWEILSSLTESKVLKI